MGAWSHQQISLWPFEKPSKQLQILTVHSKPVPRLESVDGPYFTILGLTGILCDETFKIISNKQGEATNKTHMALMTK